MKANLLGLSIGLLLCLCATAQNAKQKINPKDVTIVRDSWGVPHIYGKTDADAAYGLAWAHAEDDFISMQGALNTIKSRSSEINGKDGAIMDILVLLINANDPIDEATLEATFSPEFNKVLDGCVQGINDYAATHKKEVQLKGVFPISKVDIIKGYRMAQTVTSNAVYGLARIFQNKLPNITFPTGSNAFAFQRKKMADDKTLLVSNTHQPLEGIFGWYEAHVCSDEGWNMLGATFSTGVSIFVGTNENLGWTHTTNYPDCHDIYQLRMHEEKKLHYYFDGEVKKLEPFKVKLKVKVGFLKIPVSRTFYKSEYGITIKNDNGFYAIRFPAAMNLQAAEQWFLLNKAKNFEEFKEILNMQAFVSQTITYADKEDNIYFLSNGQFPKRNPEFDWKGVLRGDTSATLWTAGDYMPLDSLAQITNPKCGYVYNANNTPFSATAAEEDLKPEDFNKTMGYLEVQTNRSLRIQELFANLDSVITYDELKTLKYDQQYNSETFYTNTLSNLDLMMSLSAEKYPDLADVLEVAKKWNRQTTTDNKHAAIFAIAVVHIMKYVGQEMLVAKTNVIPEKVYADALRKSKQHLLKHFGSIEVELGKVQYHIRGKKMLPIGGMPENLAPSFITKYKKGTFKCEAGESYIMLAKYDENGVSEIETVHPYGASNHPESPHYDDQMDMYVSQKLKKMTLDKKEIMKNAVRTYHPMDDVKK